MIATAMLVSSLGLLAGNASAAPGPVCTIDSPAEEMTYTHWGYIWLHGTASSDADMVSVIWENDLTGESGLTYMYPQWGSPDVTFQSRGNISLALGVNEITVTATDVNGLTGTDSFSVTYEKVAPECAIDSPTSDPFYYTTDGTVDLSGTASDNVELKEVTWVNDMGGSGTATGTTSWSISGIALAEGAYNAITVKAVDLAGNYNTDTIWVAYDETAPICTIDAPSTETVFTNWGWIWLHGTASDSIKVTSVVWENALTGETGNTYMTPQWGGPEVTWVSRGNVSLAEGVNVITVSATDANGDVGTDVVTVIYIIPADVECLNPIINVNGNGIIQVSIDLSAFGIGPEEIDAATILLNDAVPASSSIIADPDMDGVNELVVRFDRQAFIATLGPVGSDGMIVTMEITGKLTNGLKFAGSDDIKVINPGHKKA